MSARLDPELVSGDFIYNDGILLRRNRAGRRWREKSVAGGFNPRLNLWCVGWKETTISRARLVIAYHRRQWPTGAATHADRDSLNDRYDNLIYKLADGLTYKGAELLA